MEKFKKLSFALAALLILAALAVKVARPEWQNYSNLTAIAGAVFFLLSLYFERHELKNFFSARSTRHGLNAFVMVLLVLGIVVIANWIVSRHPIKYDTTKNKRFTLSSLTINALKDLKQPVKVTAFFTSEHEDERLRMKTLLDDYKAHSKNLEVKLVDPIRNPALVRQYGIQADQTTVVESGTQKQTINSTREEDLTNAILKVASNRQITLYFLQGHGEPSITGMDGTDVSAVVEELKRSNYLVKELKEFAARPTVPEDCDLLVVSNPNVALTESEIKGIRDYLEAGGRAIIMDDPGADPSLDKLFEPYGITTSKEVVVDNSCNLATLEGPLPMVPCIFPEGGTPVTREVDPNAILFLPEGISISYQEKDDRKETYTPVAKSRETSWGESGDTVNPSYDEGKEKKGPLTLGLLVSKPVEKEKKRTGEMRMAVFGDANFIQNQFVRWGSWNYRIFANTVAWMTDQENLIHLPPKDEKADVMMLTGRQMNWLALSFIILIPGAVLTTGITIWVKRKKL